MFPKEGISFLRSLARNNERDWFQPRKEIYETKLKAPMIAMIEAINEELMDFAPDHVTDPKKSLYRIYRDTRFSADKTPYKTHIAAIFPLRGFDKHACAGFYFHVSTKSIGVAAGAYAPDKDQLSAIRGWLATNHSAFRKTSQGPAKLMGKLHGDSAARMPKGFPADHPAGDLIKMKQWLYWTELDLKIATSPKLKSEIVKRFHAAAPVVEMLNASLARKRAASPLL